MNTHARISTVITAHSVEEMKDVYLVLELMETDLHKVLKSLKKSGLRNPLFDLRT